MERGQKRVKTHDFENDEEAEVYLDSFLLGKPELPLEMWVKILSGNPALSIQDIQRMCRVNSLFKQMCDTGIVWDHIFIRQFGQPKFTAWKKWDTILKHYYRKFKKKIPLLKLMTARVLYDIHNDGTLTLKDWELHAIGGGIRVFPIRGFYGRDNIGFIIDPGAPWNYSGRYAHAQWSFARELYSIFVTQTLDKWDNLRYAWRQSPGGDQEEPGAAHRGAR